MAGEAKGGRKLDSLDFFLVVMSLLSIAAFAILVMNWNQMSDLEATVKRSQDILDEMRIAAARARTGRQVRRDTAELPNSDFFTVDVPGLVRGGVESPSVLPPQQGPSEDRGWELVEWRVNWEKISREQIARYVREAQSQWPGLTGAELDLRACEPPDPHREKFNANITFTLLRPAKE